MNLPNPREDEAVDALITASLHLSTSEVTAEEVEQFIKSAAPIPEEKLEEFRSCKPDLLRPMEADQMEECSSPDERPSEISEELYTAMNRKNSKGAHSAETERELKKRREEALKRLRGRKRPNET